LRDRDVFENLKISEISDTRLACLLNQKNVLIVTVNREVQNEMLVPNELLLSQNRFMEPDVLFEVYDTDKLIDPNWTNIDTKCKEYIANSNSESDE
jgi:5'(3')-deoxyribonucleotidase